MTTPESDDRLLDGQSVMDDEGDVRPIADYPGVYSLPGDAEVGLSVPVDVADSDAVTGVVASRLIVEVGSTHGTRAERPTPDTIDSAYSRLELDPTASYKRLEIDRGIQLQLLVMTPELLGRMDGGEHGDASDRLAYAALVVDLVREIKSVLTSLAMEIQNRDNYDVPLVERGAFSRHNIADGTEDQFMGELRDFRATIVNSPLYSLCCATINSHIGRKRAARANGRRAPRPPTRDGLINKQTARHGTKIVDFSSRGRPQLIEPVSENAKNRIVVGAPGLEPGTNRL